MSEHEERRCECCDLPVSMCGKALAKARDDEERARRRRALDEPGVVAAAYPGYCPSCRARFEPGEPVRHTDDGWWPVLCCERVSA